MNASNDVEQGKFDHFLSLLSPDRDEAGKRYEVLRRRLIRFFSIRGCSHAYDLADRTLARVAEKADAFDPQREIPFSSFVYGFASNILREERRKPVQHISLDGFDHPDQMSEVDDVEEDRLNAIEDGLSAMASHESELLLRYYSADNGRIASVREALAREEDCTVTTLHTKVFRLRQKLSRLIECSEDGNR